MILLALVVLAALSGYRRGVVLQLLTYGGLVVGLIVGAVLAPRVASLAANPLGQAAAAIATLFLAAMLGEVSGWTAGSILRSHARRTRFSAVDAAGGSVVSAVATLLVIWFVGLSLVNGPLPTIAREIRGSAVVRTLSAVMPRPPSLVTDVGRFLNRFGFPQVFAGLPPAPAGPVDAPTQAEAAAAFTAAQASTVQVLGESCSQIQEGSGFLVSPQYVLTNAHVVAGVTEPQVRRAGASPVAATTVLYDPELDAAVLRLAEPYGEGLDLTGATAERGDRGAILGYPGGGALQGDPAAVRRAIEALGHDIYGSGTVSRDVYELQARVRPGNSGGPFVLVDGDVAGMVFAASTTDDDIGYAITSDELEPILDRAAGSTARVSTGTCVR